MTTKFFILFSIILILSNQIFGQQSSELKDDTVFVTTEGPVEIKFPSKIFQASLIDSTAPFDIVTVGHSVQITAKSEAADCAAALVDEGKRTHTLILCYSKTMNIENMNEAYFAYNTVEDLQKKVEQKQAAKLRAVEAEKARLAKKAMDDKIDSLKVSANKAFYDRQYEEALKAYSEALILDSTNEFLKFQIATTQRYKSESELEERQAKANLEQQKTDSSINKLRSEAMKAFDEKRYDDAIVAYKELLKLNPADSSAKRRTEAMQKIILQTETYEKEKTSPRKAFKTLVSNADKAFLVEEYELAKVGYLAAKELRPKDASLDAKMSKTNDKIRLKQTEEEYNMAVSAGDEAMKIQNFEKAKAEYRKAAELFENKPYPIVKIKEVSDLIVKQNEEKARKEKELEEIKKYILIIEKADTSFTNKEYTDAKNAYLEAVKLKPEEAYPKNKLGEIDAILENIEKEKIAGNDSIPVAGEINQKFDTAMAKEKSGNGSIAVAGEVNQKSDTATAKEKAALDEKDSIASQREYTDASGLNLTNQEPKNNEVITNQQLNAGNVNAEYDSLLARGSRAQAAKSFKLALENYIQASRIKPPEAELTNKITNIKYLIAIDSAQNVENQKKDQAKLLEEIRIKRFNDGMAEYVKYERAAVVGNYEDQLLYLKNFLNIFPDASELNEYQYTKKIDESKKKIRDIREYLTRTKGNSYQAEALPYLDIELEKKYGSINFKALPEGQKFNSADSAVTNELSKAGKEILSEKPYLSLTDSSNNVKITCVAIRFIKEEAFFKFRIENSDTAEFLTGVMQLSIVKKDGETSRINANYISSFPIVQVGKEFYILYGAKDISVKDEDSFSFELNDRLKKYNFKITIPGTVYNKGKSKV